MPRLSDNAQRLAGDTALEAASDEVKGLRKVEHGP